MGITSNTKYDLNQRTFSFAKSVKEYVEKLPNVKVHKYDGLGFTEFGFNVWNSPESKGNPLMLDSAIRLACDYAIDKNKIVEYAQGGLAKPGTSLLPHPAL